MEHQLFRPHFNTQVRRQTLLYLQFFLNLPSTFGTQLCYCCTPVKHQPTFTSAVKCCRHSFNVAKEVGRPEGMLLLQLTNSWLPCLSLASFLLWCSCVLIPADSPCSCTSGFTLALSCQGCWSGLSFYGFFLHKEPFKQKKVCLFNKLKPSVCLLLSIILWICIVFLLSTDFSSLKHQFKGPGW